MWDVYSITDKITGADICYKTVSEAVFHNGRKLSDYLSENSGASAAIDYTEVSQVGKLKRVLDGGYYENTITRRFIYARSIAAGTYTVKINADTPFMKDYIRINTNVAYSLDGVTINGREATISLGFKSDCTNVWIQIDACEADETNYTLVEIDIPSAATEVEATIPTVKFNRDAALLFTTDDGGFSDFGTLWTRFNGYPMKTQDFGMHGDRVLIYSADTEEGDNGIHEPYTYPDGCGGRRRFGFSCALMYPLDILARQDDQTKMILKDIKIMRRMGISFTVHDLPGTDPNTMSVEENVEAFEKSVSDVNEWMESNGETGFKIATEPSGVKNYTYYAQYSKNICAVCLQANGSYNGQYFFSVSKKISDWTNGLDIVSFLKYRYTNGFIARWFQPILSVMDEQLEKDTASGNFVFFGGHGMTPDELGKFKEISETREDLWVSSVDEFWEYCHLVNNTVIESCTGDGENVHVKLWIPKYQCHQFREITLNLNITDGGTPVYSASVVGAASAQNDGRFTMNISLEDKWLQYAGDMLTLLEAYPGNVCIKRDTEYLIGLLKNGTDKDTIMERYRALFG